MPGVCLNNKDHHFFAATGVSVGGAYCSSTEASKHYSIVRFVFSVDGKALFVGGREAFFLKGSYCRQISYQ